MTFRGDADPSDACALLAAIGRGRARASPQVPQDLPAPARRDLVVTDDIDGLGTYAEAEVVGLDPMKWSRHWKPPDGNLGLDQGRPATAQNRSS